MKLRDLGCQQCQKRFNVLYQGTTLVVPKRSAKCAWALAPAGCSSLFASNHLRAALRKPGKQPAIKNIRVEALARTLSRRTDHKPHWTVANTPSAEPPIPVDNVQMT